MIGFVDIGKVTEWEGGVGGQILDMYIPIATFPLREKRADAALSFSPLSFSSGWKGGGGAVGRANSIFGIGADIVAFGWCAAVICSDGDCLAFWLFVGSEIWWWGWYGGV